MLQGVQQLMKMSMSDGSFYFIFHSLLTDASSGDHAKAVDEAADLASETESKAVMQPSMQDTILREGGFYDDVPYLACVSFCSIIAVTCQTGPRKLANVLPFSTGQAFNDAIELSFVDFSTIAEFITDLEKM